MYDLLTNKLYARDSMGGKIERLPLRLYTQKCKRVRVVPSHEDVVVRLLDKYHQYYKKRPFSSRAGSPTPKKLGSNDFLEALKGRAASRAPFLVADMETILNEDRVHVPYAVGVMRVHPIEGIPPK